MNKTRNDGFTLVELLAVIVILAVVILIAVTAVVPRMNNAKKKAFIDEALVYLKAGKEMLVTDNAHGCYLISDLGNYVKQNKDGYSGTIFISDSRVSLNLTNGKYYLKTDNNRNISDTDLVESAPSDFLSTCTAPTNPTSYGITYVLNGGTVSGTNPSSYTSYSDDIHLINPTKSGYRFIGWSGGKNLFLLDDSPVYSKKYLDSNGNQVESNEFSIYKAFVKPNKTYYVHNSGLSQNPSYVVYDSSNNVLTGGAYGYRKDFTFVTPNNASYILFSVVTLTTSTRYEKEYFRIEEGNKLTEFENSETRKLSITIPKGSSGNRTYIANWEAI